MAQVQLSKFLESNSQVLTVVGTCVFFSSGRMIKKNLEKQCKYI